MKTKQILIGVAASVAAGLILHRFTRGGGFIGPPQPATYANEGDNLVLASAGSGGITHNSNNFPVMKKVSTGLKNIKGGLA